MDFSVIDGNRAATAHALPGAKQLGRKVADALPGAVVSVLCSPQGAVGLFQLGKGHPSFGPSALIDRLEEIGQGQPLKKCGYRLATAEELQRLIAVPDPTARSFKLHGFTNLTPPFMKTLASRRPGLVSLDMRETHGTAELIEAFLEEHPNLVAEQTQQSGQRLREIFQERSAVALQRADRLEQTDRLSSEIQASERQIAGLESVLQKASEIPHPSKDIQGYREKFELCLTKEKAKLSKLKSDDQLLQNEVASLNAKQNKIQEEIGKLSSQSILIDDLILTILAEGSDISAEQKRRLELQYPDVTILDASSTLDLSESELTLDQVRRKVAAGCPNVKNVDLIRSKAPIDLFDLLKLEGTFRVAISYTPPKSWVVPKQNTLSGIHRTTTTEDIVRVIERFPNLESVNLSCVKGLSPIDVVCFKQLFPRVKFVAQLDRKIRLPFFNARVIELLSVEFPDAEIELEAMTLQDEIDLIPLVSHFIGVNYMSRSRCEHLVQSTELFRFYLRRSLSGYKRTQLTNEDLEQLAIQNPFLESVTKAIIDFRAKPQTNSVSEITKMIVQVVLENSVPKPTERSIGSVPYAMKRLVESVGSSESRSLLEQLPVPATPASPSLEQQLQEVSAIAERSNLLPLHVAASMGYRDAVLSLLQQGTSPKIRDAAGYRAIDLARQEGHLAVVDCILEHTALMRKTSALVRLSANAVLQQANETSTNRRTEDWDEEKRGLLSALQNSQQLQGKVSRVLSDFEGEERRLNEQIDATAGLGDRVRQLATEIEQAIHILSLQITRPFLTIRDKVEFSRIMLQPNDQLRVKAAAERLIYAWNPTVLCEVMYQTKYLPVDLLHDALSWSDSEAVVIWALENGALPEELDRRYPLSYQRIPSARKQYMKHLLASYRGGKKPQWRSEQLVEQGRLTVSNTTDQVATEFETLRSSLRETFQAISNLQCQLSAALKSAGSGALN